jgi:beta-1,4-mannosyltransferase
MQERSIVDPEARPIRLASRPNIDHENPYFRLLYAALARHGIEHRGLFSLSDAWLHEHAPNLDAVHIHWPEFLWRVDDRTRWRLIGGLVRFLRLAKRLGLQRVWTVHNLPPHERQIADLAGLWLLAREIDLFVCHSNDVAARVRRWLRPPATSDLLRMPIGNYDGVYPPPLDSAAFAEAIGAPSGKSLIAIVGQLRLYKGLDIAIQAAALLPPSMHVVIAGRPNADVSGLRHRMSEAPGRVTLFERDLTEQEVSNLLELADVVWLPYRRVSGSAALLLALTASRGVITSDLPFFREILAGSPDAGRLVPVGNAAALAEATASYLSLPSHLRNSAARSIANDFAWNGVIGEFATILRARVERESRGR